jgi:hypothetical protein
MADYEFHELVTALVDDPESPPNLAMINGCLGRSSTEDCVRLYRNLMLNIWQDIPVDQIKLHRRIDPNPMSPWGEDVIWLLRSDARRLEVQSSVPGASKPVSDAALASAPAPVARSAAGSGVVVNVNMCDGGQPTSGGRPSGGSGDGTLGNGYGTGAGSLWPGH